MFSTRPTSCMPSPRLLLFVYPPFAKALLAVPPSGRSSERLCSLGGVLKDDIKREVVWLYNDVQNFDRYHNSSEMSLQLDSRFVKTGLWYVLRTERPNSSCLTCINCQGQLRERACLGQNHHYRLSDGQPRSCYSCSRINFG
jgi:Pyruvate/2-oxoacid:ferredoxin oxidoreductase delta subunit